MANHGEVTPLHRIEQTQGALSRAITVEQIAKAMIATSLSTPAKSDVYDYPEMMAFNR